MKSGEILEVIWIVLAGILVATTITAIGVFGSPITTGYDPDSAELRNPSPRTVSAAGAGKYIDCITTRRQDLLWAFGAAGDLRLDEETVHVPDYLPEQNVLQLVRESCAPHRPAAAGEAKLTPSCIQEQLEAIHTESALMGSSPGLDVRAIAGTIAHDLCTPLADNVPDRE